jgi:hypothetical protein
MRILRVGGCSLVMALAAFSFAAAQTMEDDDPNDQRYWGFSSNYAQIQNLGASPVVELPIPVLGVELSDLTKNFGDPRGGGTRTHQGLDIMAKDDTPILSPTDAVIVRTGNGVNSGLYIRTANPGGENFVYMHLSAIASGIENGDFVKRGEIIGFVGNTGNASGGPAHLHFELRVGRTATDPFPRITSVFTDAERDQSIADAQAKGTVIPQTVLDALGKPATVSPVVSAKGFLFTRDLEFGMRGADVRELQRFLNANGFVIAESGDGSPGKETQYFGALTRAALAKYQVAKGITPTAGYLGPKTRASFALR